ncbi:MAG: hypothetical protein RUDDFDWM_001578 [Candidatus Fervidibacterota bacterium]
MAQTLDLLGEPLQWLANIDRGQTKISVQKLDGNLAVEIVADGETEDYPKIRRIFPQPQDWSAYSLLCAKVKVTCDDPKVHYKTLAFVFYDEQTRLLDYPGKPMKQQVIRQTVPVGRWVEIAQWLTHIRRSTIRQFDIYLYETPPEKPHKFLWEVSALVLESAGEDTVIFDGLIFARKQLKGTVGKAIDKVSTNDGLSLVIGEHGELSQIMVDGKTLGRASQEIPTGLLVRDVTKVKEPPTMVGGKVQQVGKEIHQHATLKALGLEMTATYKSVGGYIEISGKVADLRKEDRAVTVYFALPVVRDKWQWWDSVAIARTAEDEQSELHYLETGVHYGLNGAHSKYPLGALTLKGQGGLTLAVRMDEPVVHRIAYNPQLSLFYIAIDFGLVPEKRIDGTPLWEAPFRILVYRHDHAWGFRSALQRYYDFFPQFFLKRVKREGGWYVWGNMAETKDALEAGFAFHWGPRDATAVKWDNEHNVIALFYIEAQTYQQSHQDFEKAPTVDEVIERLKKLTVGDAQELSKVLATTYRVYPLAHTGEDIKTRIQETAQVVWQSANHNAFGQPYCSIGRYGWMQNRWGAILSCNLAPKLPNGKGWFNIHRVILPALEAMEKLGAKYDGIALDSLGGYGEAIRVNYRREHFRYSRFPLSFSSLHYQPVQVAFFTTVEWLNELSKLLHPKGMVFMANCSWGTTPGWLTFSAPYIDIFGAEHPFFADPDFIRAIAYRKPCTDLPYKPRPEWEVAWHLLHGIFPGYGNDLQTLRNYAQLLQRLSSAGWEPITGARVDPPTVRLERFGKDSEIYLVAHNTEEKQVKATIHLELDTLGLRNFTVSSSLGEQPTELAKEKLMVSLPPKGTIAILLRQEK